MINLIRFSIVLCFCSVTLAARASDSLTLSSKALFDKATVEKRITKDALIKKEKTKLKVSSCKTFQDKNTDEDNSIYTYFGDLDSLKNYRVVKETLYNGEEYLVVDILNKCKVTTLLGKPHLFYPYVINVNESETTDKKKIIEVWKMTGAGLKKHKNVFYKGNLNITEIRISNDRFIMKDEQGKFWQILI